MEAVERKSTVTVLMDIDSILAGVVDRYNKRGIYWTTYNIIKELINNKNLKITFITNKYTGEAYSQWCDEEPAFKNIDCIVDNYGNKFFLYTHIARIKFRRKKRNSRNLIKKLVNFIFYMFFTVLDKCNKLFNSIFRKEIAADFDVYQSMFYKIPNFIMKNTKIKKCILVHDVIPLIDSFGKVENKRGNIHSFLNIFENIDSSVIFFCNSNFTKDDFLSFFPRYKNNRILIANLAANREQFYKIENQDTAKTNSILNKYGIPLGKKYILSVSALDPRKNLRSLVNGFVDFLDSYSHIEDLYLVISGPYGLEDLHSPISKIKNRALKSKIIITGFIDKDDINTVYNNAFCFACLSFYEGFGLPILEAMQCGVPVISSNTSSMPEVYGDSAIGINPHSRNEFLAALREIYFNADTRQTLAAKGLERSRLFTWSQTAKIFSDEYTNGLI
ncbi:MAG: glycosyltransferase family 4 protein [Rickettsiales bacterium]|jgi:glycosyltransferase involved in cell wall biosynthesis|nr:glycosyltransferase family 4 protein [Rickettsiales bacterium]